MVKYIIMKKRNSKGILNLYLNWPIITSLYLFIVNILVYFIDSRIGLFLFPFLLIYVLFALYLKHIKFNNLNAAIVRLAESISNRQRIYFTKIDLPHVVLDTEGKIVWGNDKFLELSKNISVGKNIREIMPDLNKSIIKKLNIGCINIL